MGIKLFNTEGRVPVKLTRFPAGETCIVVGDKTTFTPQEVVIEFDFEGNADLFDLALLVDAIQRLYVGGVKMHLLMSYIPYAQQDRVCNVGESLSIRVVADFINNLKFFSVSVTDAHSPVATGMLNNCIETTLVDMACEIGVYFDPDNTVLVSPDAGANKKVLALARAMKFPHAVRADKTRDLTTGEITGTVVYSEGVGSKDFLIVDDICVGGGTFIPLAKELRKLTTGSIYLYVTHGIFSKGTKVFDGLIDRVYIMNPVGATGLQATTQPNVTLINQLGE